MPDRGHGRRTNRHPEPGKAAPHPDAAGRRARSSRRGKRSGPRSVLLAAARRGLPGGCRRGPPLRGAGHCAARRSRRRCVPRRFGPLRTHGGVARCPGRRRFRGAGGEHRRRRCGGSVYPADPGRPGLRSPFRHAPRRRHHRPLKRLVGWHRALDTVPDLRLCVGGRGGRPAPPPGAWARPNCGCCAATASWRRTCSAC